MSKLRVAVIFGGVSLEHDISLKSANSILQVIDRSRFEVIMIRIDKHGIWHIDFTSKKIMIFVRCIASFLFNFFYIIMGQRRLFSNKFKYTVYNCNCIRYILSKVDVVFPIIHGKFGEDGSLQGLLKILDIPFVGSSVVGSAISMDKDITKRLLRDSGLVVAPFLTFNNNYDQELNINFEYCVDNLGLPLFIKPANQGSSVGISKVFDRLSFYQAINLAFSFDHKILVESAIVGRELECAILGNKNPQVSLCAEIILNSSFYTYQKKYFSCTDKHVVIPAKINQKIYDDIHCIVLSIFRILQCSGMARVGFFLTPDNQIVINEVNTLPGFTSASIYPRLWEATGLSHKNLITTLVDLAMETFHQDNSLTRVFM